VYGVGCRVQGAGCRVYGVGRVGVRWREGDVYGVLVCGDCKV